MSDVDSTASVPRYMKKKQNKKESTPKAEKKPKKSKFLVNDYDDMDVGPLDRSVGGENSSTEVIENFVGAHVNVVISRMSLKWIVKKKKRRRQVPLEVEVEAVGAWERLVVSSSD